MLLLSSHNLAPGILLCLKCFSGVYHFLLPSWLMYPAPVYDLFPIIIILAQKCVTDSPLVHKPAVLLGSRLLCRWFGVRSGNPIGKVSRKKSACIFRLQVYLLIMYAAAGMMMWEECGSRWRRSASWWSCPCATHSSSRPSVSSLLRASCSMGPLAQVCAQHWCCDLHRTHFQSGRMQCTVFGSSEMPVRG